MVRPGGRGRGHRLGQDRRLPRGLPLLLAVRAVLLAGARGLAGHPVAGAGGQGDRGDRRDGVLHRRRRARAGRAADGPGARGRRGDPARPSTSTSPARSACSPRSRSTSWPTMGVHRYNHNLETARSLLPERSSPRTPGRSAGTPARWCARPAWSCAAAASSAWARPSSSAPSSPRSSAELEPDEVPLNFLNPRPGTPFGDLPDDGRRRRRCGRSPRSGSPCRARSCATPAAARSPSATSAPATACSAASTRSSSATT